MGVTQFWSGLFASSNRDSCWDCIHHRRRGGYIGISISGFNQGWLTMVSWGNLGELACCNFGGIVTNLGSLSFVGGIKKDYRVIHVRPLSRRNIWDIIM
jgi:hypothetical protein